MHALSVLSLASLALAAPAPLYTRAESDTLIEDKFIVKLRKSSEIHTLNDLLSDLYIDVDQVYQGAFEGFSASLDADKLSALRENPDVEYIEQDSIVSITAFVSQPNAPWNLARISHRALGATTYDYDDSAGEGACVYILDTGVESTHPQLTGRVINAANFAGGSDTDGNGHGTAVAGVVGGIIHGVAKKATIVSVKVLGDSGSGTVSGIISGMNFVITDSATRNCPKGAMVNLSIGGSYSQSLNNAAAALAASGKLVAVAAGSEASNVANFSPASEPSVCTVGSTTSADAASISSNYGPLLDLWAPGSNIVTTYKGGSTITLSGSSLAAPHVAGLGAYLAALYDVNPAGLCAYMQEIATQGVLTGVPSNTVNLLIFNGNPSG